MYQLLQRENLSRYRHLLVKIPDDVSDRAELYHGDLGCIRSDFHMIDDIAQERL